MMRLRHPILAVGLVACFLFVGGVLTSQGAAHTLHHAHHKAPTHASIVCSWMCAAGQVTESVEPILAAPTTDIGTLESFIFNHTVHAPIQSHYSRGPPLP